MMRKAQVNPVARTKLLDAAQKLILAKGYAATSLDDICRAAKLTKGTFFHYFDSKEDLGKKVLERFCCHSMSTISGFCCAEEKKAGDPLERVFRHVDCAITMSTDPRAAQGCLIGTMAQELSDTSPGIREVCVRGFNAWAKVFKKDLDEAKARYAPRKKMDTQGLAEYFIAVIEGSQIMAKAKQNRKIIEHNLTHFKDYLKQLFKKQ
jgi:TetR/AcrR family transcriptional regulator, transcriptional repressor for nem operon